MDEKGAVKDIDENRVHVMEAGIVRIMKVKSYITVLLQNSFHL
jgi:hypothetical protein